VPLDAKAISLLNATRPLALSESATPAQSSEVAFAIGYPWENVKVVSARVPAAKTFQGNIIQVTDAFGSAWSEARTSPNTPPISPPAKLAFRGESSGGISGAPLLGYLNDGRKTVGVIGMIVEGSFGSKGAASAEAARLPASEINLALDALPIRSAIDVFHNERAKPAADGPDRERDERELWYVLRGASRVPPIDAFRVRFKANIKPGPCQLAAEERLKMRIDQVFDWAGPVPAAWLPPSDRAGPLSAKWLPPSDRVAIGPGPRGVTSFELASADRIAIAVEPDDTSTTLLGVRICAITSAPPAEGKVACNPESGGLATGYPFAEAQLMRPPANNGFKVFVEGPADAIVHIYVQRATGCGGIP
jgi:hypothetical protein